MRRLLIVAAILVISFRLIAKDGEVAHPIKLTRKEFIEKVMDYEKSTTEWKYKGELPCVVDFYADWCRPCRRAAPILEKLAKKYAGRILVYKVDTEVERELASAFDIRGIPAFLWIPMKGKPSMTSGIGRTDEETQKLFEQDINDILLK